MDDIYHKPSRGRGTMARCIALRHVGATARRGAVTCQIVNAEMLLVPQENLIPSKMQ
jgi:hypothetical protein